MTAWERYFKSGTPAIFVPRHSEWPLRQSPVSNSRSFSCSAAATRSAPISPVPANSCSNGSIEPQWIVGGSIGAVTGAIIAGNAPEDRLPRLKAFWDEAMISTPGLLGRGTKIRHTYNELHTITDAPVRPARSVRPPFPRQCCPCCPGCRTTLRSTITNLFSQTLERLVDFDRLNRAEIRLTVGCVDLETGDDVLFDNTRERLTPEHFLASAAITPIFPPVEIDGRFLCDPGYTNNLPLEVPFAEPSTGYFTCIAVELFSLHAPLVALLDSAAERANDLIFASPTRRTLKGLEREYVGGADGRSCTWLLCGKGRAGGQDLGGGVGVGGASSWL